MKIKNFAFVALALLSFALPPHAFAVSETEVVASYVKTAAGQYQASLDGLVEFQKRIRTFLALPNAQTIRAVREQWVAMRKPYSTTETYRFFGSPIDGEGGPEGRINSWPLDEAYLDYVVGGAGGGIVNDTSRFPSLTKELIISLNEQGGEKNISVGYHAIEFLLWGQDLSSNSAGTRPFTDYVIGKGKNADRRRQYLELVTDMLVEDIQGIVKQWNVGDASSYAAAFLKEETKESLRRMLTGVFRLSGEELSQERMFVAYDTQSQEDEHSCFSDTTHFDIRFNFEGMRNVLNGKDGPGLLALLRDKDATLAGEIDAKLLEIDAAIGSIPVPFDNAIFSEPGREAILKSVRGLEDLARLVKQTGTVLGVEIQ